MERNIGQICEREWSFTRFGISQLQWKTYCCIRLPCGVLINLTASFAGAAVGLNVWAHQILTGNETVFPKINPFLNEESLITHVKEKIAEASKSPFITHIGNKSGKLPSIMVMGAKGRCGTGACDLAEKVGIPSDRIIKWDIEETKRGGPFPEILKHSVFVNCIYLSSKIEPFITMEMIKNDKDRKLSVIADVSCDATNPYNPIPGI